MGPKAVLSKRLNKKIVQELLFNDVSLFSWLIGIPLTKGQQLIIFQPD